MVINQPRHIPENQIIHCSKCNKKIEIWDGRRYRMKYRHFHCLPETRLNQIDNGIENAKRTLEKYNG